MRKSWKSVGIYAGVASLLFLPGCASKGNSEASSAEPSASQPAAASETASSQPSESKKFEITLFEGTYNKILPNDSPGVQAINEKYNIDYKPEFVPADQAAEKIPVLMASGSQPDILGLDGVDANFIKWAKQGAFLPLNDYISKYPQLALIPKSAWDSVTVDGKIYGVPGYFRTKYANSAIIRQDWLDKLHLSMPTNYQELLEVSKAFTTQDPDGNGKADTYGFVTSKGIDWNMRMGTYYSTDAYYHKNDKGQLIPGLIADEANVERLQFMRDAYAAHAVPKDWPVMEYNDAKQMFWSGKAGIYYEGPTGSDRLWNLLKEAAPDAVVVPLPAFKAPDGSQGNVGMGGFYMLKALSGKLKDDPDKVDRILTMINDFMEFIPFDDRNPDNPKYDWKTGGVGKGYTMENGTPNLGSDNDAMMAARPTQFFDVAEWAPSDEALELDRGLTNPMQLAYVKAVIAEWSKPNYVWVDPANSIHTDVVIDYWGLYNKLMDGETKIILGQEPMSYLQTLYAEWLKNGGQELVDDVNAKIQEVGAVGVWR